MRKGWILFIVALAIRLVGLTLRPMHHDEGVNGFFTDQVIANGFYYYDPSNYHGPLYFYILAIFQMLFGRSVWVLRLPTVLAGSVLAISPLFFQRWFSKRAMTWASVGIILSAACAYYSRYAIHETFFSLATVFFLYCWFRFHDASTEKGAEKKAEKGVENDAEQGANHEIEKWGTWLGVSFALLVSLKENFVFLGLPVMAAELWFYKFDGLKKLTKNIKWFFAGFIPIWVMLFSGLGRDWAGLKRFFMAFLVWTKTGTSHGGYSKVFLYFFELLFNYEAWGVLGFLVAIWFLFKRLNQFMPKKIKKDTPIFPLRQIQFLSVTSLGMLALYSFMPYKTPWCILAFLPIFSILAGIWVDLKSKYDVTKWLACGVLFYSAWHLAIPCYFNYDDDSEMYVYAQTYKEFMGPVNQLLDYAKTHPDVKDKLNISIVTDSNVSWPLPWYLSGFKRIGYYTPSGYPPNSDPDLLMIQSNVVDQVHFVRQPVYRIRVRFRPWTSDFEFIWFSSGPVAETNGQKTP